MMKWIILSILWIFAVLGMVLYFNAHPNHTREDFLWVNGILLGSGLFIVGGIISLLRMSYQNN